MKPVMLITGASSGIGEACKNYFNESYQVVTAHRSPGATYRGDLSNENFRKELVAAVNPHVFINNAGGLDTTCPTELLNINAVAAVDLLVKFYDKMETGHIFNIASIFAEYRGWQGMDIGLIPYIAAKHALKAASMCYTDARTKNIKVTCIEPDGTLGTRMSNYAFVPEKYTNFKQHVHTPLLPSDIVHVINNQLQQPPWVVNGVVEINMVSIHNYVTEYRIADDNKIV